MAGKRSTAVAAGPASMLPDAAASLLPADTAEFRSKEYWDRFFTA